MYDAFGNYNRIHNWGQDRDNGIRILADRMDAEDNSIAQAFNAAFLRNGVVPMTGSLTMNGNAITTIKAGSVAVPSLSWELDPATGFYQPATKQLAVTVNGVRKMLFTEAGITFDSPITLGGITGDLAISGKAQVDGGVNLNKWVSEKAFTVAFTATANQKVQLYWPTGTRLQGRVEIVVAGGFADQQASGFIKKTIGVHLTESGGISQHVVSTEALGATANWCTISDFRWDGTNLRWYVNITPYGLLGGPAANFFSVHVRTNATASDTALWHNMAATNVQMSALSAADATAIPAIPLGVNYTWGLSFGTTAGSGAASAFPANINMGNSSSNVAGDNLKLTMFQNATVKYGFGVSANSLDYVVPVSAQHTWWCAGVKRATLDGNGQMVIDHHNGVYGLILKGGPLGIEVDAPNPKIHLKGDANTYYPMLSMSGVYGPDSITIQGYQGMMLGVAAGLAFQWTVANLIKAQIMQGANADYTEFNIMTGNNAGSPINKLQFLGYQSNLYHRIPGNYYWESAGGAVNYMTLAANQLNLNTGLYVNATGLVKFQGGEGVLNGNTGRGIEIIGSHSNGYQYITAYNRTAGANAPLILTASLIRIATPPTTAVAANMVLDVNNDIYKSTSSERYKRDIHDVDSDIAHKALALRPILYRSRMEHDGDATYLGFIAEEVDQLGLPELVHYGYHEDQYDYPDTSEGKPVTHPTVKEGEQPVPFSVQYERIVVLQQALIKELYERLEALEAKVP